jgi:hypothetical protein
MGYFLTSVADLNWRLLDTGASMVRDSILPLAQSSHGQECIWQMNVFNMQTTALITTVC